MDDQSQERVVSAVASHVIFRPLESGEKWFELPCRTTGCYSLGSITFGKHAEPSDEWKHRAAASLVRQGWTFHNGAVCPQCVKREGNK